ncbi:MAG TPA: hypothetical protein VLU46_15495 [Thermoanaerobaculia bacterium]|nr:hypothetical protein [Thermoanaerobaculia bacterium]
MRRTSALALLVLLSAAAVRASCGSSSCPLDLNALNAPVAGQFGFDLSFQYINQNRPMIGTRGALVGEIPTDHDEVRTTNRIATAALAYAVSRDLQISASVPWISRSHLHIADGVPERFNLNSIGDVVLQSRYRVFANQRATGGGLWAIAGVKLPTGKHDLTNANGATAEVTLQPGSGTTDGIVGLSWQSGTHAASAISGSMGNIAVMPLFATATYQFRTGDVHGYRLGNELQLSTGLGYPLTRNVTGLLQVNGRVRAKDRIVSGGFDPDTLFTGGTYVYASPGVRVDTHGVGVYALVQLPLYQKVNELQLTSRANLVAGVQHRFR